MHKEVDLNNLTQNVMPLIYNACVVHCTRRNNAELQATAYRHDRGYPHLEKLPVHCTREGKRGRTCFATTPWAT